MSSYLWEHLSNKGMAVLSVQPLGDVARKSTSAYLSVRVRSARGPISQAAADPNAGNGA